LAKFVLKITVTKTLQAAFTKPLTDVTVPEHKLAVFETAVSDANAQVTWLFNGQPVSEMATRKRFGQLSIGHFRRLNVRNCLLHESDSTATCRWGQLETSAKLFLVDCPFIVADPLRNKKVPKNTDVSLSCHITNNLAPQQVTFAWKKNGQPLDIAAQPDKYEYTVDADLHKLTIKSTVKKDEATYEIYLVEPEDFEVGSQCKLEVILGPGELEEEIEDTTVTSEVIEAEEEYEEVERKKKEKNEEKAEEEAEEEKFVYALKDQHVVRKQEAVFSLACPTARTRVRWLKDDTPISPSLKYNMVVAATNKLQIRDCTLEDAGRYTAIVGAEQVSASLTVEDFLELIKGLKDLTVTEKETIKLSVEVSDKNMPGQWFKNNEPIQASEHYVMDSLNGKFELTIPDARLDDRGSYRFVMNELRTECDVQVREEPLAIVKRLQDQSCLEKTEAVFECELNKPKVAVEWFYNGQPVAEAFPEPGQYVVSSVDCKYTITLPSVNVRDQGVFSVATPNKLKTQALLTVDEMAADFGVELEDRQVKEGDSVKFSCEVNKESVKVKWMLNGERLVEDDNVKIEADECVRTVVIKKTALSDAGKVSCVLPGNKASTARLSVEEVPVGIKLQSVEVFEGEDAKFEAVLDKQVAKKDTEWSFKEAKLAVTGLRYNQDCDRSQVTHRLVIRECTMADGGEYTFKARKGLANVKLVVKELPVKFVKPLADQSPLEHSSVSFSVVLSRPGHSVKWFLDGAECTPGDKFVAKEDGPQAFSLVINDCLIPDSGRVKVKVFNDKGDEVLASDAKLAVSELPVDVVKGLGNLKCMEKDEVTFVCEFNKEVKPGDVRWFKDGIKLVDGEDNGRVQFVHEGPKQSLVIRAALMSDIGGFEVKVKDVNSSGSLKVKEEEIVFVKKLAENYAPTEGDTLVLECSTNKDKVNCEWKKYGKPLEVDARMTVERDGKVHRLTITNVKASDKMNVSCVAVKGREEVASTSGKIAVKDGPVKVLKGLEDLSVNEGAEALLKVELNKDGEQVEWFRDGVAVAPGGGVRVYSVGNSYFLRIGDCSPDDHPGMYSFKCKAAETSGRLTVVPRPITIVRPLSDKVAKEFQTVKFECELNKPNLGERIVWLKNGEVIDLAAQPDKYETKASGPVYGLVIKDTQFDDEATYSVQVKDSPVESSAQLSVTEAPLEWVRTLKDVELKENQTANLECELNKEDVAVQWFKNGQKLVLSDSVVVKCVGRVHKLTLKNCLPEAAGKYACKPPGLSSQAQLYLEEIPVEFVRKLENVKVLEGETGVFECELNKSNADVQWFRAGREIVDGGKYKYGCSGNKYSLSVGDCQLEDMSDFTIALRGRKSTANLVVEDRPASLLRPLTDKTVAEKQEIRLECEFDRANIDAVWLVNNVDVKYALGADRFRKSVNGGVYQLVVFEAKLDDAGKYSCTVKKTETSCQVKVTEQVVEVVRPLEDQEVVETQMATFTCTLSRPRLNVVWLKNGVKLPENDKYQAVKEGKVYKLVIKSACLDDEDTYTVRYAEECESSAGLRVLDAPNRLKSGQLGDKEATEEDKSVCFEFETSKKFKASDKIRWSVNGRRVEHEDASKYSMEAVSNTLARFTIRNVRLEDEGSYQAEMNGTKASGYLLVNELAPTFVKPLSDVAGVEDEAAAFECELSKAKWKKTGLDIVVKWFRGEREIKETTKYGMKRSGARHTLEVRQLAFDDVSEYSAAVMAERTSGKLTLSEGGVEFTSKMRDVEVEEKETAQFEVEVNRAVSSATGQGIPFVWSRRCGGEVEELEKSSRFQMSCIGKKLVLKVNECTMEEPGMITDNLITFRIRDSIFAAFTPCFKGIFRIMVRLQFSCF